MQIPACLFYLQLFQVNIFTYCIAASALSLLCINLLLVFFFLFGNIPPSRSFFCVLRCAGIRCRNNALLVKVFACFIFFYSLHPSWHMGRLNPWRSVSSQDKTWSSTDLCAEPQWHSRKLHWSVLGDSTYSLELEWGPKCFPLLWWWGESCYPVLHVQCTLISDTEMKSSVSHCKWVITLQGLICYLLSSNVATHRKMLKKKKKEKSGGDIKPF